MEPHFRCMVSLVQVAASTREVSGPILAALKAADLPEYSCGSGEGMMHA
jgi:hypothetical protein